MSKQCPKYGWKQVGKSQSGIFKYRRTRKGKPFGEYHWACRYAGPGQLYRRKIKMDFDTQEKAVAWRAKTEAANGARSKDKPPKFSKAIETYNEHRLREGHKESSYQYLPLWRQAFAEREIVDVTSERVEEKLDEWTKDKKWSGATRNRALAQLSGFFTFAYGRRWIDHHPTEHGRVAAVKEAGGRKCWLNMSEVESIIEHSPDWLAQIVRFGVGTGMRLGEICGITRADYQQVIREGSKDTIPAAVVTDTKNGSTLVYPLGGWPLEHVEARVAKLRFPADLIFPGPVGGSARSSIRRHLPKAVKAAGLEWGKYKTDDEGEPARNEKGQKTLNPRGVTFHSLRHSMASLALNAGFSPTEIQVLGNWRTRRIVENYAHVADETVIGAAAKMAAIVAPKKKNKPTGVAQERFA